MTLLFSVPGGSELIILFLLGAIIPFIFYLLTLQKTFELISPENRKMTPGHVWLLLIPLFGIVWHFIIVTNMADSIKAEAESRNITIDEPRPGYSIGMAMCILNCLFFIPLINILTAVGGLVCWIIYWVKIDGYRKILSSAASY